MLKSLLISGAVITGAAVVACVAYLGKKAVNTLEEIADTVEEEELEVAEVTKEIIKDVVTKGNGEILYETDYIDCVLWTGIAENTTEYCKKGDILGLKGRVQTRIYETDEKKKYVTEVVAEKVTFLSPPHKEAV